MSKTYFQHLFAGSGHLTIAVQRIDDRDAVVGFAWCSPLDQFCKRLGRHIAEGRMKKIPLYLTVDADTTPKQIFAKALDTVFKDGAPRWATHGRGTNEREVAQLTKLLSTRFGMEDLDDHVLELKAQEASDINNSSFEEQVRYLIERAGSAWVRDALLEKP